MEGLGPAVIKAGTFRCLALRFTILLAALTRHLKSIPLTLCTTQVEHLPERTSTGQRMSSSACSPQGQPNSQRRMSDTSGRHSGVSRPRSPARGASKETDQLQTTEECGASPSIDGGDGHPDHVENELDLSGDSPTRRMRLVPEPGLGGRRKWRFVETRSGDADAAETAATANGFNGESACVTEDDRLRRTSSAGPGVDGDERSVTATVVGSQTPDSQLINGKLYVDDSPP